MYIRVAVSECGLAADAATGEHSTLDDRGRRTWRRLTPLIPGAAVHDRLPIGVASHVRVCLRVGLSRPRLHCCLRFTLGLLAVSSEVM